MPIHFTKSISVNFVLMSFIEGNVVCHTVTEYVHACSVVLQWQKTHGGQLWRHSVFHVFIILRQ